MNVPPGTTSYTGYRIQFLDDAGLALTGKLAADFPTIYRTTGANSAAVQITLSDLAAITSAYSSGGIKEDTGSMGTYRLDLPDAALATDGRKVKIYGEAAGKHVVGELIEVGYPQVDAVKINGSALAAKIAALLYGSAVADGTVAVATDTGHFTLTSTDDTLSNNDNTYNNLLLVFTSGPNQYVPREISSYAGATKAVAFTGSGFKGAFPNAVTAGDAFLILSGGP